MTHTPSTRRLLAQAAAHTRWSTVGDRKAATGKARAAFIDRFERQVDPEGVLPEAERLALAESAKRAYFSRLAAKSAVARAKKAKRAA